jgi:hypothetical protein
MFDSSSIFSAGARGSLSDRLDLIRTFDFERASSDHVRFDAPYGGFQPLVFSINPQQ